VKITAAGRLRPPSAVAKRTVNGSTASKRARVSALAIGLSNGAILPAAGRRPRQAVEQLPDVSDLEGLRAGP